MRMNNSAIIFDTKNFHRDWVWQTSILRLFARNKKIQINNLGKAYAIFHVDNIIQVILVRL